MELTQVYSDSVGFIQTLAENVEVELELGDGCFVVDVLNKLIEGNLRFSQITIIVPLIVEGNCRSFEDHIIGIWCCRVH